jgi:putative metal-binding protein
LKRARPLLLALSLLLVPSSGWGGTCLSTGSGSWSNPTVWIGCDGPIPGPLDSVLIQPGHAITYDANTVSGDTIYEVSVQSGGSLTFAPGDHRMQIGKTDVTGFQVEGTLSVANGTTIVFTSTIDHPGFYLGNNSEFNSDGVSIGALRSVTSFSTPGSTSICGGTQEWDLGISPSPAGLAPGDLVQLATGAAQGRMYEIMAVSSGSLTLCPDLPDNLSRGPRLTPHAPTSAILQPGTAPAQVAAAGDRLWAWHPWRIVKAGPHEWGLDEIFPPLFENAGRFEWVGGDFSGFGELPDGPGIDLRCSNGRPPVILKHNNFHDYQQGINVAAGASPDSGCDRPNLTWNVIHDGTVDDGSGNLVVHRSEGGPVTGGVIAWNTLYRTSHVDISLNPVGYVNPAVGFDIAYNTGFQLGTSGAGECDFIETDVMQETVVQFNRGWSVSQGCGGIAAKPFSAVDSFKNNLYRGNFIQGARHGLDVSAIDNLYRDNVVQGNYVTDTYWYSIRGWAAYGNVLRGWSEGNDADGVNNLYGLSAVTSEGNFLDGAGSARADQGIFLADRGNLQVPTWIRNNVIRGLADLTGLGACVLMADSSEAHSAEMLHNVCDCNQKSGCNGFYIRPWFLPASAVTVDVIDNVVFNLQTSPTGFGASARSDTTSTVVTNRLLNLTRWPSGALPATGVWSTVSGEVARNPRFVDANSNFNYLPSSKELGAGSTPPGSSIGVRYASFDATLYPAFLRAVMTVPASIANDTLADADQDGVPDDIDDCPATADPLQRDSDGDRFGDVCDCDPLNASVYPGAPQICDGLDDECNDPLWPAVPAGEADGDGDHFPVCNDCNDSNPFVYPGAPQLCDGINNDCNAAGWPAVPANELDADLDGVSFCQGDCNDANALVWSSPGNVANLVLSGAGSTSLVWDSQAMLAGPETTYNLASGSIASGGPSFPSAVCLQSSGTTGYTDTRVPARGAGFWYLVRGRNSCGIGSFGSAARDTGITACP